MSENIGNQFNYLCPKCKKGDQLSVVVSVWARLTWDGSETDGFEQEWDHASRAACKCGWNGIVEDFIVLSEGEGKMYACQDCETEWYENQVEEVKDASERFAPGDIYTDAQCPSCGALCFPI